MTSHTDASQGREASPPGGSLELEAMTKAGSLHIPAKCRAGEDPTQEVKEALSASQSCLPVQAAKDLLRCGAIFAAVFSKRCQRSCLLLCNDKSS